jgi:hypothetical protein
MSKQISFSKFGNQVLPHFRERLSKAESTEDVKKFFVYISRELFEQLFAGKVKLNYEDIVLTPKDPPHYTMSEKLMADPGFTESWKNSDLKKIMADLAGAALHRYIHLEKNPSKTEAKIRMR